MRAFTFSHFSYLSLGCWMMVQHGPVTSAWAETNSSPAIIATVNGESLSAIQAFPSKRKMDFIYFTGYDSNPNRASIDDYRKFTKHSKMNHLGAKLGWILRRQWVEQQGISVTDVELETAWQQSSSKKRIFEDFDSEKWEKKKKGLKRLFTSYREALDSKYFPKQVYQPSQIEKYTKYLKKVHKKYYENQKEAVHFQFEAWASELFGWAGVSYEQWNSFENRVTSPGGFEKFQLRHKMERVKIENRVLEILSKTDPEIEQCLKEYPPKNLENRSEELRKCIGGKIGEFWKTVYRKADIQIHDPELKPVLDHIRKP